MEQVTKTFLSVFIAMSLMFIAIAVTNVAIQNKNADAVLDAATAQWEASNYRLTQSQLQASVDSAADPDYVITLSKATSASNKTTTYATLKLRYKIKVPFIHLEIEREATRSAR